MKKYLYIYLVLIVLNINQLNAESPNFNISAYVEGYFAKDNTINHYSQEDEFKPFAIGGNKNNEFGLNYALIAFDMKSEQYRAAIKLAAGEVPQKFFPLNGLLNEANCGFKIYDNLWLDVGFFLSNLCIESYYAYENPLTIFSIPAFVSEFYHTGAKLSYEPNENLTFSVACIDAYSEFGDNNEDKSAQLFAEYKDEDINIYYASSIGNERPDELKKELFMHHNLNFAFYNLGSFDFITQIDVISHSNNYQSENTLSNSLYYSFATWLSYYFTDKFYVAGRFTYFNNETNPFINTNLEGDLPSVQGYSLSAGVCYQPSETSFLRLEANYLSFDKNNPDSYVFNQKNSSESSRKEIMLSYGVKFDIFK